MKTTARRFDGYSETMSVNGNGKLVAGEIEIDGIEREEILFALNTYKVAKWTLLTAAKILIFSSIIIGLIALMIATDVPVLK